MSWIPPPPTTEEGLPPPLEMSEREKALRDTFVAEYLVDFNALKACMRCGFPREFATEWAQKLMDEPYVQKRIKEISFTPVDPKQEEEYEKKRIKNQLMREAHYYGPGSSHAARVSALAQLQKFYGMEKPRQTENKHVINGGVMRAPGIASLDDWEGAATASQEDLMRDAAH
jgi:hypothetical protein